MSGVFIGRQTSLGLAPESVRGTAAAPTYWIAYNSLTVADKQTKALDEDIMGIIETPVAADTVETWAEGSMDGNLHDTSEGVLLKNIFGSVSSVAKSAPNASVLDHTFSVSESAQHTSITLAAKDSNEDVRFANGMISKYELNFQLGKYFTRSIDFMSKKSASSSNTPSLTAENKFRPQDVSFKFASTVAGLSGASATPVKSFRLTLTQGLSREQELGSTAVTDIYNTTWRASLTFELLYKDTTFKDYVFNNTATAVEVALTRSDVTIGTSSNPALKFTFQPGYFTAWSKDLKKDDLVSQSADHMGMYNLSAAKTVQAVLTNMATGY